MELSSPDESSDKPWGNLEEDCSPLSPEKHMARNDDEEQDLIDAREFVYEEHDEENGDASLLPGEVSDEDTQSLAINNTPVTGSSPSWKREEPCSQVEADILNKMDFELPDISDACNNEKEETGYDSVPSDKEDLLHEETETGNSNHEAEKEESHAPEEGQSGSPMLDTSLPDSSGGAPCIPESNEKDETTRPKGSYAEAEESPRPFRHEPSPSPERRRKRSPSREHISLPHKRASPSGKTTRQSRSRDDSPGKRSLPSPKKRDSPVRRRDSPTRRQDSPRRRDRTSRSPARRRDSSRHRRSHRDRTDRSRSRSPHARDRRHRSRSPRRDRSPRHRSSTTYRSGRPPRRPWSPQANRNTGIGRPGRNLFIAGISFVITETDLEDKFSKFGQVRGARVVKDKRSGESRGYGFVSFEKDEEADEAIRAMDQTEWNGRIVFVEKSKPPLT